MRKPVALDERGRARTMVSLKSGSHDIRAIFSGGGKFESDSSTSPMLPFDLRQP
jgi:hypothetical protein